MDDERSTTVLESILIEDGVNDIPAGLLLDKENPLFVECPD